MYLRGNSPKTDSVPQINLCGIQIIPQKQKHCLEAKISSQISLNCLKMFKSFKKSQSLLPIWEPSLSFKIILTGFSAISSLTAPISSSPFCVHWSSCSFSEKSGCPFKACPDICQAPTHCLPHLDFRWQSH